MIRRRTRPDDNAVPAVLPCIRVAAQGRDAFTVTVDGTEQPGEPIPREHLGRALADVAEQQGGAVRVEIHDTDGRVLADIIHPPTTRAAGHGHDMDDSSDTRFAITYTGFLPGERVLLAVVDRDETANPDGAVTLTVDQTLAGAREIILIGSVSQTTILAGLS